jgi:DNA-binding transcriptional ArsR family regulator
MVAYSPVPDTQLDRIFTALGDATRRAILARLGGPDGAGLTLHDLAEPFPISRQAVAKHVAVLERAGLVDRQADGRLTRHRIDATPLASAAHWVEGYRQHWQQQFDALARYLESPDQEC